MQNEKEIIVQKYGGSSVATLGRIKKIAEHVAKTAKSRKVVVVVSARGDETDNLIQLAQEVSEGLPIPSELDKLLATGEMRSAALLAMAIQSRGQEAISLTGFQIRLETDPTYGKAKVKGIKNLQRIKNLLDQGKVVVVAGFQGVIEGTDEIVTLGRGGSNITAIALAGALDTDCENYTDVDGIYTIDPRIVPKAKRYREITYEQMLALSTAGAGVLMERAVRLAQNLGVKIKVMLSPSFGKSTGGTLVSSGITTQNMEASLQGQTGIAVQKELNLVKIANVPNRPMMAAKILKEFAKINIVDAVIAAEEEGKTGIISLLCLPSDLPKITAILQQIKELKGLKIAGKFEVVGFTLVDPAMKEEPGYLYRVCKAIGKMGINIELISTSGDTILAIVKKEHLKKAAEALAREFNLIL